MTKVHIVCPSLSRADRVLTKNVFADLIIVVPERQAGEYQEHNPDNEIVGCPDEIKGLQATRQWIYEKFRDVFHTDDDVMSFRRNYLLPGVKAHHDGVIGTEVDPKTATAIVQRTAETAKQMGASIFGFATIGDARNYDPTDPINLSGYNFNFTLGMFWDERLHFPKEFQCGGDHYVCLLNAYYNRYAFFDTRFGVIVKGTFTDPGGMAQYRKQSDYEEGFRYLKMYFGDAVQKKVKKNRGKQSHEWEKTLKIPF
ncbi:MAG: hypothetical protein ONB55_21915 [candidate division KSB1 bacterium]|nr:hypothetical protein [candidate division KSB1 bacterium]